MNGKKEKSIASSSVDYEQLCELYNTPPQRRVIESLSLNTLNLESRCLGPSSCIALFEALKTNKTISHLNIAENGFEESVYPILAELLRVNDTISELDLRANHLHRATDILCDALKANRGIAKLNFSSNKFDDNDAVHLADLLENNVTLTHLSLRDNGFGEYGGGLFGTAMASNSGLLYLDLSFNHIRRRGAVQLTRSITANNSLQELNVAWNGFGYEGCVGVGQLLQMNSTLAALDVSHNRIPGEAIKFVASALRINTTLKVLKIGGNCFSSRGCYQIIRAASGEHSAVTHLSFEDIPIHRRILWMSEFIMHMRPFTIEHGPVLRSRDEPMVDETVETERPHAMVILIEYLGKTGLRLVDFFRQIDRGNKMAVTVEEFTERLQAMKMDLKKEEIQTLVRILDSDADGYISYAKLYAGYKQLQAMQRLESKRRTMEAQRERDDHQRILQMTATQLPPIPPRISSNPHRSISLTVSGSLSADTSSSVPPIGNDKTRQQLTGSRPLPKGTGAKYASQVSLPTSNS